MLTLAIALSLSLISLAFMVLFQLDLRARQRERLRGLELKPNCLLTRYPIAFLSGRKSIFKPFEYWNLIPAYLREHGYEVLILEPPANAPLVSSATSASAR